MLQVATNLVCFGLENHRQVVYQSLKIDFLAYLSISQATYSTTKAD